MVAAGGARFGTVMLIRRFSVTEGDVAVRYRADPETLHDRLVIWVVGGSTVIAYTPDGDVYPLVLSSPPLVEVVGPVRPGTYARQHLRDAYALDDGVGGTPTLAKFRNLQRGYMGMRDEQRMRLFR